MTALAALSKAIRTTLVLALVGFLAFGSLADAVFAATGDHHSISVAMDADHQHSDAAIGTCPAKGDTLSHDMSSGTCCVGTCTTILGVAPLANMPVRRISRIEPFDHSIPDQTSTIEFLRPPSLTI